MKKTIPYLFVSLTSLILGMFIYRNNWFPVSIYRSKIITEPKSYSDHYPLNIFYSKYTKGTPLYSNRNYTDTIGPEELENAHVVQIPRHRQDPIKITPKEDVIVYRLLTNQNDNTIFNNWKELDIKVYTPGYTSEFTTVISKTFGAKEFTLQSGGPHAASPILIKSVSGKPMNSLVINGTEINDKVALHNFEQNKKP